MQENRIKRGSVTIENGSTKGYTNNKTGGKNITPT